MNSGADAGAAPVKSRKGLVMGAGIGALVLAAAGGLLAFKHMGAKPVSLEGVWHGQTSNNTYVIDKHDDGSYRLSVGGHRLLVKSADVDSVTHQLNLNLRTDSGLMAVWSFKGGQDATGNPTLHIDQDGFSSEDLQFQRELTSVDRSRLAQEKPAKKPLWSPAFDCGKAGTDVERMICTDPAVAALDIKVSGAVHSALTSDAAALDAQKNWLHTVRDACTDINCLRTAYQQRFDELSAATAGATPAQPADAAAPADAAPADAAPATAPTQG